MKFNLYKDLKSIDNFIPYLMVNLFGKETCLKTSFCVAKWEFYCPSFQLQNYGSYRIVIFKGQQQYSIEYPLNSKIYAFSTGVTHLQYKPIQRGFCL